MVAATLLRIDAKLSFLMETGITENKKLTHFLLNPDVILQFSVETATFVIIIRNLRP